MCPVAGAARLRYAVRIGKRGNMDIGTIGVAAAVFVGWGTLVLLLSIVHRDVAALRERMARLEGLFEGFTKQPQQ